MQSIRDNWLSHSVKAGKTVPNTVLPRVQLTSFTTTSSLFCEAWAAAVLCKIPFPTPPSQKHPAANHLYRSPPPAYPLLPFRCHSLPCPSTPAPPPFASVGSPARCVLDARQARHSAAAAAARGIARVVCPAAGAGRGLHTGVNRPVKGTLEHKLVCTSVFLHISSALDRCKLMVSMAGRNVNWRIILCTVSQVQSRWVVDCAIPAADAVLDVGELEAFLREHIKARTCNIV